VELLVLHKHEVYAEHWHVEWLRKKRMHKLSLEVRQQAMLANVARQQRSNYPSCATELADTSVAMASQ
jgi:hypothetical protein